MQNKHSKPAGRAAVAVQRVVRRLRCSDCGHLKSEHVKGALCGTFYMETVTLPICIQCKKNVCEDVEDELCQKCWNEGINQCDTPAQLERAGGGW